MRASEQSQRFFRMALAATGLALVALIFNAYTRLSEAGLGCPDWPGCYGVLFAPTTAQDIAPLELDAATQKALEKKRAAQETMQRFLAAGLSLTLFRLAVLGWHLKRRHRNQQIWIPLSTAVFIFALGVVGFLTFEYRYKALVLMTQFAGGLAVFALVWWIALREQRMLRSVPPTHPVAPSLRPRALFAIALVSMQALLGGWSMVNHAGLACPDFPTCQGQWWPPMEFIDAFTMWRDVGLDYEGKLLTLPGSTAIHFGHRIGAAMVLLYVGWFALHVLRVGGDGNRLWGYGLAVLAILLAEAGLGVMSVLTRLPLAVAIAHNALAALLLATLVTLYHVVRPVRKL